MTTKRRRQRLEVVASWCFSRKGQENLREIFEILTLAANETRNLIYAELDKRSEEERKAAKCLTMEKNWEMLFDEPSPLDRVLEKVQPYLKKP